MKLGSLFDGIGGFPYSASKFGIESVWASEIEPFPIKVTSLRFPDMKHIGDVTKINGADIEPVDIITFGSPCQDLSVAGKRGGLQGERSGLFSHAVRIIREMRDSTGGKYPRFAVWENVPGAFSSNRGEDFRAVLSEITEAEIPMPASGKWAEAGMVRTKRVDVAWRCMDAQHWGVAQRRKRIFLVADFRERCAGEILFKPEGLRGDTAESREAWEEVAGDVGDSVEEPSGIAKACYQNGQGDLFVHDITCLLATNSNPSGRNVPLLLTDYAKPIGIDAYNFAETGETAACFNANSGSSPTHSGPMVIVPQLYDMTHAEEVVRPVKEGIAPTLNSRMGTGGNQVPVLLSFQNTGQGWWNQSDVGATIRTPCGGDSIKANLVATVDCRNLCENEELSGTLQCKQTGGYLLNYQNPVRIGYAVRRLTPLECLRLQGFPDWWLDIDGMSDTAKYRAIGNSVAIPCVDFVLGGIARVISSGNK